MKNLSPINQRYNQIAKAVSLYGMGYGDVDILEEAANCLECHWHEVDRIALQASDTEFKKFISQLTTQHVHWVRAHQGER